MPKHPPPTHSPTYQAFLVRLWNRAPDGARHVTVRRVGQDGERHFRSLVDLYAYLDGVVPANAEEPRDLHVEPEPGDV